MIKFFDLFAGISGFRSGLESIGGFECIGFCEKDKYASRAYRALYSTESEVYFNDATTIETNKLPQFNLLVAGFPCQPFSVSGQRGGFNDERGTLFFEIARILNDKRPEFFCLENVPGLLSNQSGKTCAKILDTLSEIGYSFEWNICNSAAFGVPQSRKRLYIIGYSKSECSGKVFPLKEIDAENPKQLIGGSQGKRIYSPAGTSITLTSSAGSFGGKSGLYFIDMNPDPKITDNARCITARYDAGVSGKHKGERSGVLCEAEVITVSDSDDKIISIQDQHGINHNGRIRKLTPCECWRLQGFTDVQFGKVEALGLSDNQLYKLAGNAVTVNVVKEIGERIKQLWQEYYTDESEGSI